MRPRLLELFCGAGGSAIGYHRAGFDVVGVDLKPQPRFPFEFVQANALEYVLDHGEEFDAIHASPPCQHYAPVTRWRGKAEAHADLVDATREALRATRLPYVIENVPGAPLLTTVILCGSMFGLGVRRHRLFEIRPHRALLVPPCRHLDELPFEHKRERAFADRMGCDWMNKFEARQAIPPAYTEFVGKHLMKYVQVAV